MTLTESITMQLVIFAMKRDRELAGIKVAAHEMIASLLKFESAVNAARRDKQLLFNEAVANEPLVFVLRLPHQLNQLDTDGLEKSMLEQLAVEIVVRGFNVDSRGERTRRDLALESMRWDCRGERWTRLTAERGALAETFSTGMQLLERLVQREGFVSNMLSVLP